MSYVAYEQSEYNGHPLELYRFALGADVWLFTSADVEVDWGGDTYSPIFIKRSGFTVMGDGKKATLEIEVAAANAVAMQFRSGWLTGIMVVNVYRHHQGDVDYSLFWKGRVTGCKWSGSTAQLACDSAFSLFQRAGLRRKYQIGCPHVLYSAQCGVNAAGVAATGTVTAISGNTLTISSAGAHGDHYYLAGKLQFDTHLRLIVGQVGNVITLVDLIPEIVVGDSVTIWPGCDRTMTSCTSKFNNVINFGGLPYLPSKNPFSGDALV